MGDRCSSHAAGHVACVEVLGKPLVSRRLCPIHPAVIGTWWERESQIDDWLLAAAKCANAESSLEEMRL